MLLSLEELESAGIMHPQIVEFYKQRPPAKYSYVDHTSMREGMVRAEKILSERAGPTPEDILETYHDIPMRDGYMSTLKIFRPAFSSKGPLWVLLFGGGYVSGSREQHTANSRLLVRLFGATVVNISYRLAPEYRFPTAPLDSIDSVRWISDNATKPILQADPSKGFIVGGVSAGGNLTSILSRHFQTEPLSHPLTGQWLSVAGVMSKASCPPEFRHLFISHGIEDAPGLTKGGLEVISRSVQFKEDSDLRYAVLSPSPIGEQPRTYIHVDGMDPLRDCGLIYHEMLERAGVPVKIDFYPGCPHTFQYAMPGVEVAQKANIDTVVGFGWLMQQDISRETAAKALGLTTVVG